MRGAAALNPVIVGGGPAGAAAACLLARAGRPPLLLEREPGPAHKVCGEFLSGEAVADLAGLGIDVAALGAAPIGAVRLVHRGRMAESRLPFLGAGLSRRVLDEALLARAAAQGAEIRRGVRVRTVHPGAAGAPVAIDTGGTMLHADTLFLASGKHDLRGVPRLPVREPEPLIGFKLHLHLAASQRAALRNHVEVLLLARGYAGLQLVEDGVANLCLLVDRNAHGEAGQDFTALLDALQRECPHLAARLAGARPAMPRPLSIFRVPYGHVHHAVPADHPGIFRLGDQVAVTPSFCGDGMSIALHTAHVAVAAYLAHGNRAALHHRAVRADVGGAIRLASGLYGAARRPAARAAVVAACRIWPGLLRAVARRTRVPAAAMARHTMAVPESPLATGFGDG